MINHAHAVDLASSTAPDEHERALLDEDNSYPSAAFNSLAEAASQSQSASSGHPLGLGSNFGQDQSRSLPDNLPETVAGLWKQQQQAQNNQIEKVNMSNDSDDSDDGLVVKRVSVR